MPDTFTPEQISQILEEFFRVVGTRQYIGARYVPIFGRKDEETIEWDNDAPYEPLTIVLYQGNSYTSRQYVPVGVEITNQDYWAITGNYNAQIEQYRREVADVVSIAQEALESASGAQNDIDTLLPKNAFSSDNTVKDYIDASVSEVQNDIDTLLPKDAFSSDNTVKDYIDANKGDEPTALYQPLAYAATKVGTINLPSELYFQGATTDNEYIYAYAVARSGETVVPRLYKLDFNFDIVDTLFFETSPGHGNSLAYDEINSCVIIASTTRVVTFIDVHSFAVTQQISMGSASNTFNPSQIALDNNYLVMCSQGHDKYYFYKRISNKLFYLTGIKQIPQIRGKINNLQDSFLYNSQFYSISSGSERFDTFIDVFGINQLHITSYRVTDLREEVEGAFTHGNSVYMITASGNVFTIPAQTGSINSPLFENAEYNYSLFRTNIAGNAMYYNELLPDIAAFAEFPYKILQCSLPFTTDRYITDESVVVSSQPSLVTKTASNLPRYSAMFYTGSGNLVYTRYTYSKYDDNILYISNIYIVIDNVAYNFDFTSDVTLETVTNAINDSEMPSAAKTSALSLRVRGILNTDTYLTGAQFFGIMV